MLEALKIPETEIMLFGLALIRMSSCFVVMPIIGAPTTPRQLKILLSLLVTMILFPAVKTQYGAGGVADSQILFFAMREVCIGLLIGFIARLIFVAVEMAGQLLGLAMVLNAAEMMNPAFGESNTIMRQFMLILGTLLFLAINGHHLWLTALFDSYTLVPLSAKAMGSAGVKSVTELTAMSLSIGLKLASPVIAVMLFLDIGLGIVGRAVPQINVLVTSFPINITVGMLVLGTSLPFILFALEADFTLMGAEIFRLLKHF